MSILSRIITLMCGVTLQQVRRLPPAERQLLIAECQRLIRFAEPAKPVAPKGGVLADLRNGRDDR